MHLSMMERLRYSAMRLSEAAEFPALRTALPTAGVGSRPEMIAANAPAAPVIAALVVAAVAEADA